MFPRFRVSLCRGALLERACYLWRGSSYWATYCFVVVLVAACVLVIFLQAAALFARNHSDWDEWTDSLQAVGMSYAVVIDAGSSGSRVHLFMWPPRHSAASGGLLDVQPVCDNKRRPLVHSISPGLSSLRHSPQRVVEYLRPLLEFALRHIPAEKHHNTCLYLLATAGMRLLNKTEQQLMMRELRSGLTRHYPFIISEQSVQVISGREEGIYQWISINFVLGRLGRSWSGPLVSVNSPDGRTVKRRRTVAALDMGGASMQVALEVASKRHQMALRRGGASLSVINLGYSPSSSTKSSSYHHSSSQSQLAHRSYTLYVRTFLGYGANEMLKRHNKQLLLRDSNDSQLYDPCLVKNYRAVLSPLPDNCLMFPPVTSARDKFTTSNLTAHNDSRNSVGSSCIQPDVVGTGDWTQCEAALIQQIRSERVNRRCVNTTSSTTSTKQLNSNSVEDSVGDSIGDRGARECTRTLDRLPYGCVPAEMYAFSEFWYSTHDILHSGGRYNYQLFRNTASKYCSTPWSQLYARSNKLIISNESLIGTERLARQCFKSAYLTAALHEGLGVSRSYSSLTTSSSVVAGGRLASWTLGALLYKLPHLPAVTEVHSGPHWQHHHHGVVVLLLLILLIVVLAALSLMISSFRYRRNNKQLEEEEGIFNSFYQPSTSFSVIINNNNNMDNNDFCQPLLSRASQT